MGRGVLVGVRVEEDAVAAQLGNCFNGTSWSAPVNIDSKAANSVSGPVLIFLMSVSCRSAMFCVAGNSTGDAFIRS